MMSSDRLQVFVSSSMAELAPERHLIKEALRTIYVDAFLFEIDAGARPESIRQTYRRQIEQADLYIGLFWNKYGPYTIEEYEYARKLRKPCLIYEKRLSLSERDRRLAAFLQEVGDVQRGITPRYFQTEETLVDYVKADVARWQAEKVRRAYAGPYQVEWLGDRHIERTTVLDEMNRVLLTQGEDGQSAVTRAVLHGIGGLGKSTVAAAFAWQEDVRHRFPDGVLWATLGQTPDLTKALSAWGWALHDPTIGATGYPDAQTGALQLRSLLAERACLLIIDDLWQAADARALLVGGPRSLVLITSRSKEIADEIGATAIELPEMRPVEALSLVEKASAKKVDEADRETATWLMEQVGYLPLALELMGAQLQELTWAEYRQRWERRRLRSVVRSWSARGREDNLWDCLELSVDALAAEDRERYLSLGVFPEDAAFTAGACAALWGWPVDEALDLLISLAGKALVRRLPGSGVRRFALHDLFYEYVQGETGPERRVEAHRQLVEGYRRLCGGAWAKGPDDGYYFDQLVYHMVEAELLADLYGLVTQEWMESQLHRVHSHRAFAADLLRVVQAAVTERPTNLLQLARACYTYAMLGSLAGSATVEALAALAYIGEVERAVGHAELIQDPARRGRAYHQIAVAASARGETTRAKHLLVEAVRAARQIVAVHEQASLLSDLAPLLFLAGEQELADRVAADADRAGMRDFYGDGILAAAQAYVAMGHTEKGRESALIAWSRVERDSEIRKIASLVRLGEIFRRTGDLECTREVEAERRERYDSLSQALHAEEPPSPSDLIELAEAHLEVGEIDLAERITTYLIDSPWCRAGLLARIAIKLALALERERAACSATESLQIIRELLQTEDDAYEMEMADHLGVLSEALARVGRKELAIELADLAPVESIRPQVLARIALALAQSGDSTEDVRRTAEASLIASRQLIDHSSRKQSWQRAVDLTGQRGREPLAPQVIESGNPLRAIHYFQQGGIGSLSRFGIREYPTKLAKVVAKQIRDIPAIPRLAVLGRWANSLALAGVAEESEEMAARAIMEVAAIDEEAVTSEVILATALCDVAEAFARIGRFEAALDAAERIGVRRSSFLAVSRSKVQALRTVAQELEKAGRHEQAIAAANVAFSTAVAMMSDDSDPYFIRSSTLNRAAEALAYVGDRKRGDWVRRQALTLALRGLEEIERRQLLRVGETYLSRESVEPAVLNAVQAAVALGDQSIDMAPIAFRIAQRVTIPKERAEQLCQLARILTDEAGQAEEGLRLLIAALESATLAGLETVLKVLTEGATTLAAVDDGALLTQICAELDQIDSWFLPHEGQR